MSNGAATGASAIDFKAKGEWVMNFDYGQGSSFMSEGRDGKNVTGWGGNGQSKGSKDNFSAAQRVRLQLDAVASESLSGTVFFELGTQVWGNAADGGALGADGKIVKLRRAYVDWIVPQTDLKFRMGLQGVSLPNYVFGASQVFDADVAGITFSNKFNDNVTLTGFWLRPLNDNFDGAGYNNADNPRSGEPAGFMDNFDLFGLTLPLSFDGVKVTPWAMIGAMGPNATTLTAKGAKDGISSGEYTNLTNGTRPAVYAVRDRKGYDYLYDYSTTYHFGVTGEVTAWDPFRLAWDINYGAIQTNEQALNRGGWYAALLAEYKLDWATPGLYGWYSSGDDDDVTNGSERMASLDPNGTQTLSNFSATGSPYLGRDGILGVNQVGTWGIGARLKDMSFLEGLKHTFLINYMGGTNSPEMARYILGKGNKYNNQIANGRVYGATDVTDFNKNNGLYLTTADSALEFGLQNQYKVYDNLTMYFDVSYMALFLDDVWKKNGAGQNFSQTDAWDINLSFVYSF